MLVSVLLLNHCDCSVVVGQNLPRVRKPGKDGVLQAVMTSLAYYERTLSKVGGRPAQPASQLAGRHSGTSDCIYGL